MAYWLVKGKANTMDINQLKYDIKVIRRGYKNISAIFVLTGFCLLVIICLFTFLLVIYEPSSDWHTTSFVLQSTEYRYSRGGGVLDIYTTEGRRFVINHNEETIRYQLVEGSTYNAIYSDDFFHDIIKALDDDKTELLSITDTKSDFHKERIFLFSGVGISLVLAMLINGFYSISCVKEERKRMLKYQKSKKKRK